MGETQIPPGEVGIADDRLALTREAKVSVELWRSLGSGSRPEQGEEGLKTGWT